MRMKPVGIAIAAATVVFRLCVGDYDDANKELAAFYSQIVAADFSAAAKSINDAIQLWPGNARYYGWRAYVESQQLPSQCPEKLQANGLVFEEKYRAMAFLAAADYRRAIQLNSRDAVAYFNLSWLDHLLNEEKRAMEDIEAAIAIDPGNAAFRMSSGMLLEEQGDVRRAKERYKIGLELSPSMVDSRLFKEFTKRNSAAAESVLEAAVASIEANLQNENNPIWEAKLGKLYLLDGKMDRADVLLSDAARQLPNLPLVWSNLGEIREKEGEVAAALEYYKKAHLIRGSLAEPYLHIGEIEYKRGNATVASQQFLQSIRTWQIATAITASHNNRLYRGPFQRIDDLLPTTFVWYITPCVASRAWGQLAQLHPQKLEYKMKMQTCESLPTPHRFAEAN